MRFTGKIDPYIYHENMGGSESFKELFDIKNDPKETENLVIKMPKKVIELSDLYFKELKYF
jgi:hypothetical protein